MLEGNSYHGPFACLRVEIYGEPVPQPSGKSASSFCCHSTRQKSHSSAFLTHTAKIPGYVFNCKPVLTFQTFVYDFNIRITFHYSILSCKRPKVSSNSRQLKGLLMWSVQFFRAFEYEALSPMICLLMTYELLRLVYSPI